MKFIEFFFEGPQRALQDRFNLFKVQLSIGNAIEDGEVEVKLFVSDLTLKDKKMYRRRLHEVPRLPAYTPQTFAIFMECLPYDRGVLWINTYMRDMYLLSQKVSSSDCFQISNFHPSVLGLFKPYKAYVLFDHTPLERFYMKDMPLYRTPRYEMTLIPKDTCLAVSKKRKAAEEAQRYFQGHTNAGNHYCVVCLCLFITFCGFRCGCWFLTRVSVE